MLAAINALLIFVSEDLHLKLFDFLVGSYYITSFSIVSAFILAMALGAYCSVYVRYFHRVEAWLAIYYLILFILFPYLPKLFGELNQLLGLKSYIHYILSIVGVMLAVIPAFLMGMCFPCLAELNKNSALTYAQQGIGAFLGLLLFEFILFPHLGAYFSLFALSVAHFFCSLYWRKHKIPLKTERMQKPNVSLITLGCVTGGIQGFWLFFAEILFRPFMFVHPFVIALMLLGQGLGGFLWYKYRYNWQKNILLILLGLSVSALTIPLTLWLAVPSELEYVFALMALLILPVSVPIGSVFSSYLQNHSFERKATGQTLLSLACGNTLGLLLTGLGLTMLLSPLQIFVVLATLTFIYYLRATNLNGWKAISGLAIPILVMLFVTEDYLIERSTSPGDINFTKRVLIEYLKRTPGEISAVFQARHKFEVQDYPWQKRLYQSGFSAVCVAPVCLNAQATLGALPTSFVRETKKALVIGAGTGRTSGAVAQLFEHTDVVDMSPGVHHLIKYLHRENFDLLRNPNVTYIEADAISLPYWLEPNSYDLIINAAHVSFFKASYKLFTTEFAKEIKRLLKPSGIYVTWHDTTISSRANQILLNSSRPHYKFQKLYSLREFATYDYFVALHSDEDFSYQAANLSQSKINAHEFIKKIVDIGVASRELIPTLHHTSAVNSVFKPSPEIIFSGYKTYENQYKY